MHKTNKLLGATLLISGTSIGAAVLALPVTTAKFGFIPTCVLFIASWICMVFAALVMLEVNLWLEPGANIISMAEETLGVVGKYVAWAVYLLLLYTLMTAYLAGLNELFSSVIRRMFQYYLNAWQSSSIIITIVGMVLLLGIRYVDYLNRILILGLVIAYFSLSGAISSNISAANLLPATFNGLWLALPVTFTAFGFQIIIPTIRGYVGENTPLLLRAIFLGSLIPLGCYLIWEFLIVGVIPHTGPHSLTAIKNSGRPIMGLVLTLQFLTQNITIAKLAQFFAFFAIATSFIGVSLSLFDFLSDGFHSTRSKMASLYTIILTFIPPLVFVLTNPKVFMSALGYAGALVAVLLVIIPCLMAFSGRYIKKEYSEFTTPGGPYTLVALIIVALAVISIELAL